MEKAKRFLAEDKGAWVGKGAGNVSSQKLMELALTAIGERYQECGLERDPPREAILAALLVRKFEIEGYSKQAADDLLKLIA